MSNQARGEIREAVAKVRPGDYLRVEVGYPFSDCPKAILSGEVWEDHGLLRVGTVEVRPAHVARLGITAVLEHRPRGLTADELDALGVWAVVRDRVGGGALARDPSGAWRWLGPPLSSAEVEHVAEVHLVREGIEAGEGS